jgi:hypothetical protein
MLKATISLLVVFSIGLVFFVSIIGGINYGIHAKPYADESALTDEEIEALFDTDAPIDPSLLSGQEVMSITFYYPDNPQDPLGGGRTCSDGSTYFRDQGKPVTSNLFLNTYDGRVIQGSIAVPHDKYHPMVPLGASPTIKIRIPGYNAGEPAEVHDHFGHMQNPAGGWWECTSPNRIDLAVSGPEEENLVVQYWRDHNLLIGDTYKDPNPMNRGACVMCEIISPDVSLPPGVDLPDYSGLSYHRQLLLKLALSKLGCTYVWGAAGPDTFDCSGYVLWLYRQIGNSRPVDHWTGSQYLQGTRIPADQVQPGDCIYFRGPPPGHVGIWLGGGKFIHASGGKLKPDKVKINDLARYSKTSHIYCYVRFMDPGKDISTGVSKLERSVSFMEEHDFIPELKRLAEFNISCAARHGMDFRMALVCASQESSGGKQCFRACNPYGYGSSDFSSWEEATEAYYSAIAAYGFGGDPLRIFRKYRGADNGYAENCTNLLNSI